MLWLTAYFTAAACAVLMALLGVALYNARRFPQLERAPAAADAAAAPGISILIPARNEAHQIGATVRHLLAQHYRGACELIVLDDQSGDGTDRAALAAAAGDLRLRVLAGAPLPPGWVGKSWACHQLAQAAQHDWLLFTDADVQWRAGALAAVLAHAQATGADLLSVWPTQQTQTWAERLVVPLLSYALLAYLPVGAVHCLPYRQAAAANGQCLLFRRAAYAACGGHAAVRSTTLEDVLLAQHVKAAGLRLRLVDAAGLLQARMYTGWPAVRDGFAKNILAGHLNSIALLLLSTAFHLTLFVLPWLWLLLGGWWGAGAGWPWLPLLAIALGIALRAVTAASARHRLGDALLMPISVLLMTRIAAQALIWQLRDGGPQWKGRSVVRGA